MTELFQWENSEILSELTDGNFTPDICKQHKWNHLKMDISYY